MKHGHSDGAVMLQIWEDNRGIIFPDLEHHPSTIIPNYTAWRQRQVCVSRLSRDVLDNTVGESQTHDLSVTRHSTRRGCSSPFLSLVSPWVVRTTKVCDALPNYRIVSMIQHRVLSVSEETTQNGIICELMNTLSTAEMLHCAV